MHHARSAVDSDRHDALAAFASEDSFQPATAPEPASALDGFSSETESPKQLSTVSGHRLPRLTKVLLQDVALDDHRSLLLFGATVALATVVGSLYGMARFSASQASTADERYVVGAVVQSARAESARVVAPQGADVEHAPVTKEGAEARSGPVTPARTNDGGEPAAIVLSVLPAELPSNGSASLRAGDLLGAEPTPERSRPLPAQSNSLALDRGPAPVSSDEIEVRALLSGYRAAYDRLDAVAAKEIWPSLDQRALARRFEALVSQELQFDDCRVAVRGVTAAASCSGVARYVRRVGSRTPQAEPRTWMFVLAKETRGWQIQSVEMR